MGSLSYSTFFAGMKTAVFVFFILITQSACPDNPTETECGENQIDVNGTCECAEGYHWNEDQTQCKLDTTSHNFVWEIDTLGISLSYLKDVAIIDENNIWVVGDIETDSSSFNTAHWDGSEWELISAGSVFPKYSIFAFNNDDIWIASSLPFHYDGNYWRKLTPEEDGYPLGLGYINAIWGTSSSNIFFVGDSGTIVHYNGGTFTKMESTHGVRFMDIDGTPNAEYVFVAGYTMFSPVETQALIINNGIITELYYSDNIIPTNENDLGGISSVSVYGDTAYFVTFGGLWKYNFIDQTSKIIKELDNYGYRDLNVQTPNDIFTVGGGFNYVHYNGASWDYNRKFIEMYDFSSPGADFKGNTIVIVGHTHDASHAIIGIGTR